MALEVSAAKFVLPEFIKPEKKAFSPDKNEKSMSSSKTFEGKIDSGKEQFQAAMVKSDPLGLSESKKLGGQDSKRETDPKTEGKEITGRMQANDNEKKSAMKPDQLQQAVTPQTTEKSPLPNTVKAKHNPDDLPEDKGKNNEKTINPQQSERKLFPELSPRTVKDQLKRRGYGEEDEEDENGQQRRRKPANFAQQRKPLTILEGAKVSESQTQDMFISSSHSASVSSGRNKTTVEQLKGYELGTVGNAVFETVIANTDYKEKNGIGQNMQKNLFNAILSGLSNVEDVLSPEYRKFVREVVQGTMKAAKENNVGLKDMVKMFVSGMMAMSPHDDDAKIMAEAIKTIVSEVIYGKINLGYNMKSASYYLGAALYTLTLYYKNYQSDIEFSKDLEQAISTAFSESIWKSTGEISNYSQAYAKTNIEQFMLGRVDEEKAYQKNVLKGMILSPIKNLLNK